MMSIAWLLLVPYCSLAFGIHGGEFIQNINRQVRNLVCALPFGLVCGHVFGWQIGLTCFGLGYGGVSLAFNSSTLPNSQPTSLWLAAKGMITCPFGGVVALPLTYWIGYRTKYTNVLAEYLSGTFYGIILVAIIYTGGF